VEDLADILCLCSLAECKSTILLVDEKRLRTLEEGKTSGTQGNFTNEQRVGRRRPGRSLKSLLDGCIIDAENGNLLA
jgi:hypothetical protein